MCIFPKKKSEKVPGRSHDCSKIYIFMSLFMFSHFAFPFFASCCIFSIKVILDGIESFPWALCTQFKGHSESWLSWVDYTLQNILFLCNAMELTEVFIHRIQLGHNPWWIRASIIPILEMRIRGFHSLTACLRSHILDWRSQAWHGVSGLLLWLSCTVSWSCNTGVVGLKMSTWSGAIKSWRIPLFISPKLGVFKIRKL